MRPILPEELKWYDPFDKNQREKILEHFKVKVDIRGNPNAPLKCMQPKWGYVWKYGGVSLVSAKSWNEDFARTVVGLAVYLYVVGVHPGLDDRLAIAYIRQGYENLNLKIKE
ncbi:hypothetical protein C4577_04865 [Candidatus Parcubacteria bacterium]|nr:MAG: hypothetical protein C4577_04865 [Candidatus Parcubacteria bacterium]